MKRYIVALDSGTTSARAILFDEEQTPLYTAQKEFRQIYPRPGWVEHDPMELYSTQYGVMMEAITGSGVNLKDIACVGIANQRETTVVWERATGRPVCNAIVWQCRRTSEQCEAVRRAGHAETIRKKTGLPIDAYFSATKISWILDNVPFLRARAEKGELAFGTVDSWLLYKLTGGKVHKTDYTNAARTMLFDIHRLCWDEELCRIFGVPMNMLAQVYPSVHEFGSVNINGHMIPLTGMAGDQQSALFAQGCLEIGEAKNTYGTGCFLLMNTGEQAYASQSGLITTLAASGGKKPHYAIEGSVFAGGSVVQWLRDELRLITESADSEYFARKIEDNGGVYIVPAFTGLGAPHWDMYARGAIFGLSRASGRSHIIRAALESIAYQIADVADAIRRDTGISLSRLCADGGASQNDFLMQFQSDILSIDVVRPRITETTALGAAMLAGLGAEVWESPEQARRTAAPEKVFSPKMQKDERDRLLGDWKECVERVKTHA